MEKNLVYLLVLLFIYYRWRATVFVDKAGNIPFTYFLFTFRFFYKLTWLSLAIYQVVILIECVTLYTILENFISFFLWNQNKQGRWFFGWRSACLPYILYSDNDRELGNKLIVDTIEAWCPGECKLVNAKAKKPWVQGCVEKGNHSVKMITAKGHEKSSNHWVLWLLEIQFKWSIRFQIP